MTVTLAQAWKACAVLDAMELDRAQADSERAAYLALEDECDPITPANPPAVLASTSVPPSPSRSASSGSRRARSSRTPARSADAAGRSTGADGPPKVDRELEERIRQNKRARLIAAQQRRRA